MDRDKVPFWAALTISNVWSASGRVWPAIAWLLFALLVLLVEQIYRERP